jgi:transcription antitermination factor NusG
MPKLLANIQDQKLYLDQDYESYEALKELDGKRVEVTIKEFKNTRSNRANRYYWGVVIPSVFKAFAEVGIKLVNHEQGHEACRIKFLMEEIQVGEESFRVPKSTSRMKTDEFANYIFVVVDYLREYYNFVVPEPREKF